MRGDGETKMNDGAVWYSFKCSNPITQPLLFRCRCWYAFLPKDLYDCVVWKQVNLLHCRLCTVLAKIFKLNPLSGCCINVESET